MGDCPPHPVKHFYVQIRLPQKNNHGVVAIRNHNIYWGCGVPQCRKCNVANTKMRNCGCQLRLAESAVGVTDRGRERLYTLPLGPSPKARSPLHLYLFPNDLVAAIGGFISGLSSLPAQMVTTLRPPHENVTAIFFQPQCGNQS